MKVSDGELRAEAGVLGVSQRQVDRWRSEGLLATGEQRGLGRGRGTAREYPGGAIEQLRAVVKMRASGVRTFKSLRVHLWLEGADIPVERVRADLLSAIPILTIPDDEERAFDCIDAYARGVEEVATGSRLQLIDRRRVQRASDRMTALSHLLMSAFFPAFQPETEAVLDGPESGSIGELMERALDIDRGRTAAADYGAWLTGASGEAYATASVGGWLNLQTLRQWITEATLATLTLARSDVQAFRVGGAALRDLRRAGHVPDDGWGLRGFERLAGSDLTTIAGVVAMTIAARAAGYERDIDALTTAFSRLARQVEEARLSGWDG